MTNAGTATDTQPAPAGQMWKLPGVRLFASGHYPGQPQPDWPPAKVRAIAAEAKRLGPSGVSLLIPPAVLGHEENQDWLEDTSLPAAGWVDPDSVKAEPDPEFPGHVILTGDIVDVPDKVKTEQLDTGAYKFGSVEFYTPKDDFGKPQGLTIRRFGLLGGGSIPNVKRLGPLPKPVPMPGGTAKFSEAGGAGEKFKTVAGDAVSFTLAFSERQSMDRTACITAIKAAMPTVSQATLDALSDDQLKEFVAGLPQQTPAATVVAAAEPTRDEMVAALVASGQDQATVAAMNDADLKAAFDLIKPPVASMGDCKTGGGGGDPKDDTTKMSEAQKAIAKQLADSKAALAELHRFNEQTKREAKAAQVEPVCNDLVKSGLTPAFVNEWIKPQLLALDNTHAIHRFSEGGVQKSGTAFQAKLASAKNLSRLVAEGKVFVKFGEKLPGGGTGDTSTPEAKKAAAVQKARDHAATIGATAWSQTSFGSADGFVNKFSETFDKNPDLAMKMIA